MVCSQRTVVPENGAQSTHESTMTITDDERYIDIRGDTRAKDALATGGYGRGNTGNSIRGIVQTVHATGPTDLAACPRDGRGQATGCALTFFNFYRCAVGQQLGGAAHQN